MSLDATKVFAAVQAMGQALASLTDEERLAALRAVSAILPGAQTWEPDPATVHKKPGSQASGDTKRVSLVEFLTRCKPATNSQRITAFAAYRQDVEGKVNFARSDLKEYFATAKLAMPGNFDRDFGAAVSDGYIHEDGANSYLTQTGESAVKAGFDGKGKSRGATKPKKGRAKRSDS